jgi:DNA-directed RNA polymerase subunit RPC12/RpoP
MQELKWARFGNMILVECPGCNKKFALDHEVADDGTVTPSMDCPECAFHEFVKLKDWRPLT